MLDLKKIAVTGSIASGKSTVCQFFKDLGAYLLSTDEIVHKLLSSSAQIIEALTNLLGKDIVVDSSLDRALIAKKVFANIELLQCLENILHPEVKKRIEEEYLIYKNSTKKHSLFIVEIPLLFEYSNTAFLPFFDHTVSVSSDWEIRKKRFLQSTKYSEEQFEQRDKRQIPQEEKNQQADFIIDNRGDLNKLKVATQELFHQLIHTKSRY